MFLTLYINHGRTWMLLVQYNQNYFAVHFKMYLVHASHFFMWYFFLFVVILIMIHVVIAHVACVKVWLHLTCWHFKYYSLDDIYGVKTYLAALCTFWDGEKMLNSYQVTWPDQKLVILREREREKYPPLFLPRATMYAWSYNTNCHVRILAQYMNIVCYLNINFILS